MKRVILLCCLLLAALFSRADYPATAQETPQPTAQEATLYGFFPSPPEVTVESILRHYDDISRHADFVLLQPNVPWEDFVDDTQGDSQASTDISNQVTLTQSKDLQYILVVDPLNGLNRREFGDLPADWNHSFADAKVRAAFSNFTLWLVKQFHPRYLGLASEINTYMTTYPEDAPNYLSLYNEVYAAVKAEAPETQIFVTFQWEDFNHLGVFTREGEQPYQVNWNDIEQFEPHLDLWVISTYPYAAFRSSREIPADYYTPLLTRTTKPLGIGEGGYSSKPIGTFYGSPDDQIGYLNAVHNQIGSRMAFWTYLILNDLNMDSYGKALRDKGLQDENVTTLSAFQALGLREVDGTPKPALAIWDSFRQGS